MSSNTPKQKKNNTVQITCGFKPKSRVINQEEFLSQCNKFLKSRGLSVNDSQALKNYNI